MKKAVYIVSDLHFGCDTRLPSSVREAIFFRFLDEIKPSCRELIILGDLFDFWFEYRRVVPRRFIPFLGELKKKWEPLPISIFFGNHDSWYRCFFPKYMGAEIVAEPQIRSLFNRRYFLAHGDGLGKGDVGYKFLKSVLRNAGFESLFRKVHPDFSLPTADFVSETRRNALKMEGVNFLAENHRLIEYSQKLFGLDPDVHAAVFGHLHCLKRLSVEDKTVFFMGDWIKYFSYLKITEEGEDLCQFIH